MPLRGRVVRENGHDCTYLVFITPTELYIRNMKTGVQLEMAAQLNSNVQYK